MPRKKKHPIHMTDEEALNHIFHPEIAKAVRKHLKNSEKPKRKRNDKRSSNRNRAE